MAVEKDTTRETEVSSGRRKGAASIRSQPRTFVICVLPTDLLIQLDISHRLHSLLSRFLFLEQLLLARLVAAADRLAGLDQHVLREGRGGGGEEQRKEEATR